MLTSLLNILYRLQKDSWLSPVVGCDFVNIFIFWHLHYHIKKKETWYINKGKFKLKWIDTKNGSSYNEFLEVGDVITNEIGEPHQLEALEDSEVFEVSTRHYDDDSYRIWKGD